MYVHIYIYIYVYIDAFLNNILGTLSETSCLDHACNTVTKLECVIGKEAFS